MMNLIRRALLLLLVAVVACSQTTTLDKPTKFKPPPPDDPVVSETTPDKSIHCDPQYGDPRIEYRDIVNPCILVGGRQVEVKTVPPQMQADGGLPVLDAPPSPWPDNASTVGGSSCTSSPLPNGRFITARVELPCITAISNTDCSTVASASQETIIAGDPQKTYRITIRVRGVTELRPYTGGQASPSPSRLHVNGSYGYDVWSVWRLSTSSSATQYFLNEGTAQTLTGFDYTADIEARGGDRLVLSTDSRDSAQLRNVDKNTKRPITINDIPPAPLPFDGEFIQVDFVSAVEIAP